MGSFKYLEEIINKKLENVHTSYLAKVLSVSGNTAKIQPLGLVNDSEGTMNKQSVLTAVPICSHVRHFSVDSQGHLTVKPVKVGDVVLCLVCERNISDAKMGKNVAVPYGRHNMSDSVIVGLL